MSQIRATTRIIWKNTHDIEHTKHVYSALSLRGVVPSFRPSDMTRNREILSRLLHWYQYQLNNHDLGLMCGFAQPNNVSSVDGIGEMASSSASA
jgi:hypothetical protein